MPEVSVIVPIYNSAEYLSKCLDSVLCQSLSSIEIICINDGSTDSSLDVLNDYASKGHQIKVFNQPNGGPGAARNFGISQASGEFIHFLDSDDYLAPDAYELLVKRAKEYELDVVMFGITPIFENEDIAKKHANYVSYYRLNGLYPDIYSGKEMLAATKTNDDWLSSACIHLIRRSFLATANVWFPEGVKFEDNAFTFDLMMAAQRVGFEEGVQYQRFVRERSIMTSGHSGKEVIDRLKIVGYMQGSLRMNQNFLSFEAHAAARVISSVLANAEKTYITLSETERQNLLMTNSDPNNLLWLFQFDRRIALKDREAKRFQRKIDQIQNSWTQRIGRAITAPVRGFRHLWHRFKK